MNILRYSAISLLIWIVIAMVVAFALPNGKDQFADFISKSYQTYHLHRFQSLMELRDTDYLTPISPLENYQEQLNDITPKHPLASIKKQVIQQLISLNSGIGNVEQSDYWIKKYLEFDPNNPEVMLQQAELYKNTTSDIEVYRQRVEELYLMFPQSQEVADAYALQLIDHGQYVESLNIIMSTRRPTDLTQNWQMFWGDCDRFDEKLRRFITPVIDGSGRYTIVEKLPANSECVGIDFGDSKIIIEQPVIEFRDVSPKKVFGVNHVNTHLHHLIKIEQGAKAIGNSEQWLYWKLPDTEGATPQTITFTGWLIPILPRNYKERIQSVEQANVNSTTLNKLLAADKKPVLNAARFEVFWSDNVVDFHKANKVSMITDLSGHQYNLTFNIESSGKLIRVDLPDRSNITYNIKELTVTSGDSKHTYDFNVVSFIVNHAITRQGNMITSTGADPFFVFKNKIDTNQIGAVHILGEIE